MRQCADVLVMNVLVRWMVDTGTGICMPHAYMHDCDDGSHYLLSHLFSRSEKNKQMVAHDEIRNRNFARNSNVRDFWFTNHE